MRLANLDLDAGMVFSPLPDGVFRFAESFEVSRVRAVLADFESAIGVDERLR